MVKTPYVSDPELAAAMREVHSLVEAHLPQTREASVLGWRVWVRDEAYLLWIRLGRETVPFLLCKAERLRRSGACPSEFARLTHEVQDRMDAIRIRRAN